MTKRLYRKEFLNGIDEKYIDYVVYVMYCGDEGMIDTNRLNFFEKRIKGKEKPDIIEFQPRDKKLIALCEYFTEIDLLGKIGRGVYVASNDSIEYLLTERVRILLGDKDQQKKA